MLKPIAASALALLATACTLHQPANKQEACVQAERQAAYNQTLQSGVSTSASQAKLQQTIAASC